MFIGYDDCSNNRTVLYLNSDAEFKVIITYDDWILQNGQAKLRR